jgi:hypothetical protein
MDKREQIINILHTHADINNVEANLIVDDVLKITKTDLMSIFRVIKNPKVFIQLFASFHMFEEWAKHLDYLDLMECVKGFKDWARDTGYYTLLLEMALNKADELIERY